MNCKGIIKEIILIENQFYLDSTKYFDINEAIYYSNKLLENKSNIIVSSMDVENTEKQKFEKVFFNEVFPIIEIAKLEGYKKVKFLGNKNNSIDAIMVDPNGEEVNFECTTAIDYYTRWTALEYLKENSCLITGPHTKAKQIKKNEQVKNDSNICFYRKNGERNYIESKGGEFEDGLLLISKYVDSSTEKILTKIQKGQKDNCYQGFSLILTSMYDLKFDYDKYISDINSWWKQQKNNPFNHLYILNYDDFYDIKKPIQKF